MPRPNFSNQSPKAPSGARAPRRVETSDDEGLRLQKVLAQAGVASRRTAEEWIQRGRVTVNGQIAKIGSKVQASDDIAIDGHLIKRREIERERRRVLLYYKPAGEICSRSDEKQRPTVFESLPQLRGARWISIGRLDYNTSGLLIFTTCGEFAHRLMHPSFNIVREYAVRVMGELSDEQIQALTQGVILEDGPAKFETLERSTEGDGSNQWYHVTLSEGRNREIRRMFEAIDVTVSRLIRVRYGDVLLPRALKQGGWMELSPKDVQHLSRKLGLASIAVSRQSRLTTRVHRRKRSV